MRFDVFQLPVSHPNCFRGTDFATHDIKLEDYVCVYSGTIDLEGSIEAILEYIFNMLNVNHPKDYYARSLSVSDLVCCRVDGKKTWWYVDSFGFTELQNII